VDPSLTAVLGSWRWRTDVIVVLAVLAATYVTGWRRLRTRDARSAPAWRLALYVAGLGAIGVALLSPVATLGSLLFSAHMVQHELLTMVAPPLLLLGNPLPAVIWSLPARWRRAARALLAPGAPVRRGLRLLTFMPVTWPLYVGTLWLWHWPAAYEASLRSELVHNVQHLSFFLTATLFWWPIIDPAPRLHGHVHHGIRVAYVVPAAMQSQALGLIFAFLSTRVLYPHYLAAPRLWGLSALQDQSASGIIMMQVEGMVYLATVLVLVARMLAHEERMTRLHEEHGRGR
jgi:cytochrome c oxidase assembly factor CtaG